MINKEFGSDFHYINEPDYKTEKHSGILEMINYLCFSGRSALYSILDNGIKKYTWKKIYVPSYYCHEVYDFIEKLDIVIEYYQIDPLTGSFEDIIEDQNNYVLLIVNFFGINTIRFDHYKNIITIEDLTHDLSKIEASQADYAFGSLRKILPIPVGGFIKTNEILRLQPSNFETENITFNKLLGMGLKTKYLEGSFQDKDYFRNLLINSEQQLEVERTVTALPQISKNILYELDIVKLIDQKKNNLSTIKSYLSSTNLFETIGLQTDFDYALVLKFKKQEKRDQLRNHLISNKIYPMVLWPNQKVEQDIQLENILLFIHVDFRYTTEDMMYISTIINQFTQDNV